MTAPAPLDCAGFAARLFEYIDGELDPAAAQDAATHESACPSCAQRARVERAVERRLATALLSGVVVPPLAFDEVGAGAPDVSATPERPDSAARGRMLRLRRSARVLASLAAVAVVAVTAMWSLCIPPFECAYLRAVEQATEAEPLTEAPLTGAAARVAPPPSLAGFSLADAATPIEIDYRGGARGLRARYEQGGEAFTAIWSDLIGAAPSFRRHAERDGQEWWIAEENGRNVVTYICPETRTLCALVGELPEERLRAIALTLRCE